MENHRVNLVLPKNLHSKLESKAKAKDTTVTELIKKFIKVGLIAVEPGTELYLKTGDEELARIIFL